MPTWFALRSGRLLARGLAWSGLRGSGRGLHRLSRLRRLLVLYLPIATTVAIQRLGGLLALGAVPCAWVPAPAAPPAICMSITHGVAPQLRAARRTRKRTASKSRVP